LSQTSTKIITVYFAAMLLLLASSELSLVHAQCSQASLPTKAARPLSVTESSSDNTAAAQTQSGVVNTAQLAGAPRAVTVLEDTPLRVMNNQPISSRLTKRSEPLSFTIDQDVVVDNLLVIPCGATVHGVIVDAKKAGVLTGSTQLIFELRSLELGGQSYPLYTYQFKVSGTSKTKPTEKKIKTGAVVGAVVLSVLSGSANSSTVATQKLIGAGTGAALGAGIGMAVSAASPAPIVSIPAESEMIFTLSSPVAVTPVDAKEAERLARGMKPGGPVLYIRDEAQ
jgi:hypothetical protein